MAFIAFWKRDLRINLEKLQHKRQRHVGRDVYAPYQGGGGHWGERVQMNWTMKSKGGASDTFFGSWCIFQYRPIMIFITARAVRQNIKIEVVFYWFDLGGVHGSALNTHNAGMQSNAQNIKTKVYKINNDYRPRPSSLSINGYNTPSVPLIFPLIARPNTLLIHLQEAWLLYSVLSTFLSMLDEDPTPTKCSPV